MVQVSDIVSIIKVATAAAKNETGISSPTNMQEYNKLSDNIYDRLNSKLPVAIKFKDAVTAYHIVVEFDQLSAETYRNLMEKKFGSYIH